MTAIKTKLTKLPNAEIEITGAISLEQLAKLRSKAVAHIQKDLELPGFRKGKVPEAALIARVGEKAIIEEAAELALQDEYGNILTEHKQDTIGRPSVTFTKVAVGSPVEFSIKSAIVPEVKLPDYSKIAKAEMAKELKAQDVTEKDIDAVAEEIRKQYATHEHHENDAAHAEAHAKGEVHDILPDLTDEFVQKIGDFKDLADFRVKIRAKITDDRARKAQDVMRAEIIEKLIAGSEIELPELLVEVELNKMNAQFEDDIEQVGLKPEDYLKHIKKTETDLRKEWRTDAEKRAKMQLIFNRIAVAEKLLPTEKEIDAEADKILKYHKNANVESVKVYTETILANENVFQFLEGKK